MANVLGPYNPEFFAREALLWLRARKGFISRVNTSVEREYQNARQGDTITVKRPGTFVAQNFVEGTGTTAQDLIGQKVQISLTVDKEVKFALSTRERAYTRDQLLADSIGPAIDAVAQGFEQELYGLLGKVGSVTNVNSATAAKDYFNKPKHTLRDQLCPIENQPIHYLIDPEIEELFASDDLYNRADATGQGANGTLLTGVLGPRFGVMPFVSTLAEQTRAAASATLAAAAGSGDRVGALNGAHAANVGTVTIDGLTDTQTLASGVDRFQIAGDPTIYTVQSAATVASNAVTINIYPLLQKNFADNAVVTFIQREAIEDSGSIVQNVMFHRDAFALVTVPLPTQTSNTGVQRSYQTDPQTGFSLQVRMWEDGDTDRMNVAFRALGGVQVLNPQLATKAIRSA